MAGAAAAMPPQRAAAASASAAIASLSAQNTENGGETHNAPCRGRKKAGKFVDDDGEYKLSATKHEVKPSVLENSTGPVVHYEANTFCGLPAELKYHILEYLDSSAYTVLNLLLVSKVWYATLTMGNFADRDWQRRCKLIGVKRRSAGCKTWRETFMYLLHRRCAECFRQTTVNIGQLFDAGYRWLVVCETCQILPGPFQTHSNFTCRSTHAIPQARLLTLKQSDREDGKYYLASSVKILVNTIKAERAAKTAPLLVGLEEAKGPLLFEVIDHVEEDRTPHSAKLSAAVKKTLSAAEASQSPEELVEMWNHFNSAIEAARVAFEAKQFIFDPKNPCLFQSSQNSSNNATWADEVVTKEVTIDQYVEAALAAWQVTIDFENMCSDESYYYGSDDEDFYYTRNNLKCKCGGTAAMECDYSRCYYCCPGCFRHSSKLGGHWW